MKNVYLLLGSNLNDRLFFLKTAYTHIAHRIGNIIAVSAIYETAAWGNTQQPDFLNCALHLQTSLLPFALLRATQSIERDMGRVRVQQWEPRQVDIDILMYDNWQVVHSFLHIPHVHLPQRRFALQPLSDIAAEVIHPVLNKSVVDLLANCPNLLEVRPYTTKFPT